MKKILFIISLLVTIVVIITPIKPIIYGWFLSLLCGFSTGWLFVEILEDKPK